jgi:hypothetical protein
MDLDEFRKTMFRSLFPRGTGGARSAAAAAAAASGAARPPPPDLYPLLMGFVHAINWRERGVFLPLLLYALLLCVAVAGRRHWWLQAVLFCSVCGAVAVAPWANAWLAARGRWRALGFTQNYFDERGIFVIVVHCTPLLAIAFVQLLMAFFTSASLLIKAKRMEITRARKQTAAAAAAGVGGAAPAAAAAGTGGAAPAAAADPPPAAVTAGAAAAGGARRRRG